MNSSNLLDTELTPIQYLIMSDVLNSEREYALKQIEQVSFLNTQQILQFIHNNKHLFINLAFLQTCDNVKSKIIAIRQILFHHQLYNVITNHNSTHLTSLQTEECEYLQKELFNFTCPLNSYLLVTCKATNQIFIYRIIELKISTRSLGYDLQLIYINYFIYYFL